MATRPQQRNLGRLSEIAQVAVKHGFGYFFERHRLTDLLPWHEKLAPLRDGEGSERGETLLELVIASALLGLVVVAIVGGLATTVLGSHVHREQADAKDPGSLDEDQRRLREVEVELDRCWDLLRQRRALRDAGGDPDQAQVRDADTVERYRQ